MLAVMLIVISGEIWLAKGTAELAAAIAIAARDFQKSDRFLERSGFVFLGLIRLGMGVSL